MLALAVNQFSITFYLDLSAGYQHFTLSTAICSVQVLHLTVNLLNYFS